MYSFEIQGGTTPDRYTTAPRNAGCLLYTSRCTAGACGDARGGRGGDTPDTLENYPDSATRDLLRHHPFRLERLRTPQRYIGLDARRARAEALTKALDELCLLYTSRCV